MNADKALRITAGVVASLMLVSLCWAAYLSGPIGRRNAVFFFGVLAILVFLEWRKTRRRKPDSCINCERDAKFCWPCCDAIAAVKPADDALRVKAAQAVRDCLDRDQADDDIRPLDLWIADSVLEVAHPVIRREEPLMARAPR